MYILITMLRNPIHSQAYINRDYSKYHDKFQFNKEACAKVESGWKVKSLPRTNNDVMSGKSPEEKTHTGVDDNDVIRGGSRISS